MGALQRGFLFGESDENLTKNIDEFFVINYNNGRSFGFCKDDVVKYVGVVSVVN